MARMGDDFDRDDSDLPPERDPNTPDMFGGAPVAPPARTPVEDEGAAYTVIARTYRPQTFDQPAAAPMKKLSHW